MLVIIGLFFVGCSTGSQSNQSSYDLSSYKGGNAGLSFNFADNMPPSSIRDNGVSPFTIRVLVENKGEYTVPEGKAHVTISGINPSDINLENPSQSLGELRGVKIIDGKTIPGGTAQALFSNLKYKSSVVSGSIPMTLYANLCYPYETKATAIICVKGDTTTAVDDNNQVCEITGDKKYANSAAPVTIENVKEMPYGRNSIQIQFDIVHKPLSSNAAIYENGSLDSNCNVDGVPASSASAVLKKDRVTYKIDTGLSGLNCEGTGKNTNTVTLSNNRYTVVCIQDTTGQSEYEKPIFITLAYDYLDRISKQITVEHVDVQ